MHPFTYSRATDPESAVAALLRQRATPLAGGTDLMQLLKDDVLRPERIVDISRLKLTEIEATPQGLVIGALAKMADVAEHRAVRDDYPVIAEALLMSASAQVRNMATMGGNLLQRTRCVYFRDTAMPCNKREPGSGCSAIEGENWQHAILGGTPACVAVHPSDLAVALVALDAAVRVAGPNGERRIKVEKLHRLPAEAPHIETVLEPGELITAVEVPAAPDTKRSRYLKVRDRASFEFALTSAAVALDREGGVVRSARIAVGGVATKPWRLRGVEQALAGQKLTAESVQRAAAFAAEGARPLRDNGFKVTLLQRTVARAIAETGELA